MRPTPSVGSAQVWPPRLISGSWRCAMRRPALVKNSAGHLIATSRGSFLAGRAAWGGGGGWVGGGVDLDGGGEVVRGDRRDEGEDHDREHEAFEQSQPGQGEDVEADVLVELRVLHTERHRVAPQQVRPPAADR